MPTRSILTTATARRLLDVLKDTPQGLPAHVTGPISADVRCTVSARRTEAGTLVVWADVQRREQHEHTGPRLPRLERSYVRSIDEARKVSEMLFTLAQAEAEARPLLRAREAVYQLAESRVIPDAWVDGEPPIDAPMEYDAMSLADCDAWMPLLLALPLRK